ncbi:MAG: lipopolysaccharide heptosyltransferase I [Magnetococcales bacterium]|nr:lipopolysaccharide heptosyltransferase I [Magnetococcales bacterium]
MRLLLVKISSMGDLLHCLPAVSDFRRAHPDAHLTWLCEPAYADIPRWHPGVDRVVEIPLRQWRRTPWESLRHGAPSRFLQALRQEPFDCIVDAQGLLKSALLARLARGINRWGPDESWVRERLALPFYRHRVACRAEDHVVLRLRRLLAGAGDYALPATPPVFGLDANRLPEAPLPVDQPFVMLLHGTAWSSKLWPEPFWGELARRCTVEGWRVLLPRGNAEEEARAHRLREAAGTGAVVLPPLSVGQLAALMVRAVGVVGLDSGLAHLATCLSVPAVTLFGATNPAYSGLPGNRQIHLQSSLDCAPCMLRRCPLPVSGPLHPPCFRSVSPDQVLRALKGVCR